MPIFQQLPAVIDDKFSFVPPRAMRIHRDVIVYIFAH